MTPDQQNDLIENLIEATLKDLDDDEIYDLCCEFLKDGFLEYTKDELIKEAAELSIKIPEEKTSEEYKGFADEVWAEFRRSHNNS